MPRYLVSFNEGAMDHITEEELPAVGEAARAASEEAMAAGVFVFAGGLERQRATIVAPDGLVTDGPFPETKEVIGGFVVLTVSGREEAHVWAAKFAAACRCAQEVRELGADPESEALLQKAQRLIS